jgi:aspartyl-tRNA(Asn)/glutamyl-tRNA(Gln) amidotransferase subunit A
MNLCSLSAKEMRRLLDERSISVEELTEAHLQQIHRLDPQVHAFITVTEELARQQAQEAQKRIDQGETTPLLGIPVALKDNIVTRGIRTTCASRILENYIPPYDATLTARLKEQGAVILGKTNLDEFAMGSSTEYSAFFPTRNPWDLNRVPGGSSGGSAAAVSACMVPIAYGSDTGGSVRQPAALCGVVGLKPTYGRVSRFGLVAYASSLDQIGPLARNVEDVITAFEASFGLDPKDPTTVEKPYDPIQARTPRLKNRRLALPKELFSDAVDPSVREVLRSAFHRIAEEGAEVEEVSLSMLTYGVATYYIIAPSEASSNLARYDGVRYGLRMPGKDSVEMMSATRSAGFGKEVQQRIVIGTYALSAGYYDAYYLKAHQARTLMKKQFQETFQKYDLIVSPTSPIVAFKLGERLDDPLALKLVDFCTIPVNIGGFPAISLNAGFADNLPVGIQLIANSFCEADLFSTALAIEEILQAQALPPITQG